MTLCDGLFCLPTGSWPVFIRLVLEIMCFPRSISQNSILFFWFHTSLISHIQLKTHCIPQNMENYPTSSPKYKVYLSSSPKFTHGLAFNYGCCFKTLSLGQFVTQQHKSNTHTFSHLSGKNGNGAKIVYKISHLRLRKSINGTLRWIWTAMAGRTDI